MAVTGKVFDIQRFSLHDGCGIRTIVFLKGCPLNCKWCSNPESQKPMPQLMQWVDKCIGCKACLSKCSQGALSWEDKAGVTIDRVLCNNCGKCTETCYAEALVLRGTDMTSDEVMDEVIRDQVFYKVSGGGLTLSGGEPLAQPAFAKDILRRAKERKISTAIETTGHTTQDVLQMVDPYIDLYLFDVKHLDSAKHREYTGIGNEQIQQNLRWLAQNGRNLIIRIPVIPGFNDNESDLQGIIDLAASLGVKKIHMLPYHEYGRGKYYALGRKYGYSEPSGRVGLDMERFNKIFAALRPSDVKVSIGG